MDPPPSETTLMPSAQNLEHLCNGLLSGIKLLSSSNHPEGSSSSAQLPPTISISSLCQTLDKIVRIIQFLDGNDGDILTSRKVPIQRIRSGDPPPPPPATLMSIMQLRAIYTAIEIVWVGAIRSFVKSKANSFEDYDSLPPSMLVGVEGIEGLYGHAEATSDVFNSISIILAVCKVSFFTNMMLERNMKRILVTLIILKDDNRARDLIRSLLESHIYKYQVVCALRALLGSSPDITAFVSRCLTQIMLSDGGLYAVLSSYLNGKITCTIIFTGRGGRFLTIDYRCGQRRRSGR